MVCIKDFDTIEMTPESTLLLTMIDCDSVSLEECASLQERSQFFDQLVFSVINKQHWIDYEKTSEKMYKLARARGDGKDVKSKIIKRPLSPLKLTQTARLGMSYELTKSTIHTAGLTSSTQSEY